MGRERPIRIVLLAALLIASLVMGRQYLLRTAGAEPIHSAVTFREWFWESRALDLVAQVGLIFAGALGVAALLPRRREQDDT